MIHRKLLANLIAAACAGIFCTTALAAGQTAAPAGAACPWMDTTKTPEERTNLLLEGSSLDQVMRWLNEASANENFTMSFGGVAYPAQVPCVGFHADVDGPWGIAYLWGTTGFPVPVAQAASWDLELTRKKGAAMADEAWSKQYNTLLAPGIDIVRHPWGGRNAEYLGEDPYLAGKLAGVWVKALRESNPNQPVAAILKHFVGNQQELERATSSSNIDERTLQQIYLLPYAIAFDIGQPAGVMCGFNQLNGIFSCEHPTLLTKILRDQIGFKGLVVTDNGSQHSTAASLRAGLSQELSLPKFFAPAKLREAMAAGQITEAQIRKAAYHVVYAKFANGLMDNTLPESGRDHDARKSEHFAVAQEMAEKGAVLLKNERNVLPLKLSGKRIALIGPTVSNSPTNGISAETVCTAPLFGDPSAGPVLYDCRGTSPLDAITARAAQEGNTVVFDGGSDVAAAAKVAASADVVVVFGYNRAGEFFDLPNLNLFSKGDELVTAVAAANPNTVVLLQTAGPVLMPWADRVPSILEMWWSGVRGGEAMAGLLFGDVNPSGKLPVTFMKNLADLPTGGTPNDAYPGTFADGSTTRAVRSNEIRQVNYKEGLKVGYRWYDAKKIAPLFAFGHGLSYTSFVYSDLEVTTDDQPGSAAPSYNVRFTVGNTGKVAGAEVPQVYLTLPAAAAEPGKRMVGFDRIELAPGEQRVVQITVDGKSSNRPFSIWDVKSSDWRIVNGEHMFTVGASSRDLRLTKVAQVSAAAPTFVNVTSRVKIEQSGLAANRVTGKYAGTVKFTNTTGEALEGPLTFRFEGLAAGVQLDNRSGVTDGVSYVTLPGSIAPGATTTVTVTFTNPSKGAFTYTPKLFSGTL
ncbi:beta-glucosidase [Massilia sp. MP_M2]|uniref:beta-glucosidase family protein n=1 Tax=Massilia sp. MP_M2 TaxID=3071713 RepID=UPI00319EB706